MVKKTHNIKEYQKEYYKENRERILLYAKQQRQERQGDKFSTIKKDKAESFKIIRRNVVIKF